MTQGREERAEGKGEVRERREKEEGEDGAQEACPQRPPGDCEHKFDDGGKVGAGRSGGPARRTAAAFARVANVSVDPV